MHLNFVKHPLSIKTASKFVNLDGNFKHNLYQYYDLPVYLNSHNSFNDEDSFYDSNFYIALQGFKSLVTGELLGNYTIYYSNDCSWYPEYNGFEKTFTASSYLLEGNYDYGYYGEVSFDESSLFNLFTNVENESFLFKGVTGLVSKGYKCSCIDWVKQRIAFFENEESNLDVNLEVTNTESILNETCGIFTGQKHSIEWCWNYDSDDGERLSDCEVKDRLQVYPYDVFCYVNYKDVVFLGDFVDLCDNTGNIRFCCSCSNFADFLGWFCTDDRFSYNYIRVYFRKEKCDFSVEEFQVGGFFYSKIYGLCLLSEDSVVDPDGNVSFGYPLSSTDLTDINFYRYFTQNRIYPAYDDDTHSYTYDEFNVDNCDYAGFYCVCECLGGELMACDDDCMLSLIEKIDDLKNSVDKINDTQDWRLTDVYNGILGISSLLMSPCDTSITEVLSEAFNDYGCYGSVFKQGSYSGINITDVLDNVYTVLDNIKTILSDFDISLDTSALVQALQGVSNTLFSNGGYLNSINSNISSLASKFVGCGDTSIATILSEAFNRSDCSGSVFKTTLGVSFGDAFSQGFNMLDGAGSVFKNNSLTFDDTRSFFNLIKDLFKNPCDNSGQTGISYLFSEAFNRENCQGSVFKDDYDTYHTITDYFENAFFKINQPFLRLGSSGSNLPAYRFSGFNLGLYKHNESEYSFTDVLRRAFFSLNSDNLGSYCRIQDSHFFNGGDLSQKLLWLDCSNNPVNLKWCDGHKPDISCSPDVNVTNNVPVPSVTVENNVPAATPTIKNYVHTDNYVDTIVESNNWSYQARSKYDFFNENDS